MVSCLADSARAVVTAPRLVKEYGDGFLGSSPARQQVPHTGGPLKAEGDRRAEGEMETGASGQEAAERKSARVPWLVGLSGRLRLDVAGQPAQVLQIHDGTVSVRPAAGAEQADAVATVDNEDTLAAFNRGELNPVVAALQGRLSIAGDRAFAIKVILGLQAAVHPPPPSARAIKADGGPEKEG
jgi:hypothetical protein